MIRILTGDCLEVLRTLPDASVHCCVTSPPYYGLRDYGTATWEGGDVGCDHIEMRGTSEAGQIRRDGQARSAAHKTTYRNNAASAAPAASTARSASRKRRTPMSRSWWRCSGKCEGCCGMMASCG